MKTQPFWKTRHSAFDIKLFHAGYIIIAHELCTIYIYFQCCYLLTVVHANYKGYASFGN